MLLAELRLQRPLLLGPGPKRREPLEPNRLRGARPVRQWPVLQVGHRLLYGDRLTRTRTRTHLTQERWVRIAEGRVQDLIFETPIRRYQDLATICGEVLFIAKPCLSGTRHIPQE